MHRVTGYDRAKAEFLESLPTYDVIQLGRLLEHQTDITCEVIGLTSYAPGREAARTLLGRRQSVAGHQVIDSQIFETVFEAAPSATPALLSKAPPNTTQYDIQYEDRVVNTTEYSLQQLYFVDRKYALKSFTQKIKNAFPNTHLIYNTPDFGPLPADTTSHRGAVSWYDEQRQQRQYEDYAKQAREYINDNILFNDDGTPINTSKFPKHHIALPRQMIPDTLFKQHYTISQVDLDHAKQERALEKYNQIIDDDPNSPYYNADLSGEDTVDPNDERLHDTPQNVTSHKAHHRAPEFEKKKFHPSQVVSQKFLGMKRTENIIPLQRPVSLVGTFFHDGESIRLKTCYSPKTGLWYSPTVDYDRKALTVQALREKTDTKQNVALSLMGLGTLLAGYAGTSIVRSTLADLDL